MKHLRTVSHSGCTNLHSHQQSTTALQHWLFLCFLVLPVLPRPWVIRSGLSSLSPFVCFCPLVSVVTGSLSPLSAPCFRIPKHGGQTPPCLPTSALPWASLPASSLTELHTLGCGFFGGEVTGHQLSLCTALSPFSMLCPVTSASFQSIVITPKGSCTPDAVIPQPRQPLDAFPPCGFPECGSSTDTVVQEVALGPGLPSPLRVFWRFMHTWPV